MAWTSGHNWIDGDVDDNWLMSAVSESHQFQWVGVNTQYTSLPGPRVSYCSNWSSSSADYLGVRIYKLNTG